MEFDEVLTRIMQATISMLDDLFRDIEKLSKELHCSRSKILTEAAKEYIEKLKNKKTLESLNKVYSEKETEQEAELRRKGKRNYAELLKGESG